MWKASGLDLAAHDGLMGVLGKGYPDVYLPQKNRPEDMEYFGFIMTKVHGLSFKESMDEEAPGGISSLPQKTGA